MLLLNGEKVNVQYNRNVCHRLQDSRENVTKPTFLAPTCYTYDDIQLL
jgi:hypothetical protein